MDHELWMARRRIEAFTRLLTCIEALEAAVSKPDFEEMKTLIPPTKAAMARSRLLAAEDLTTALQRWENWLTTCGHDARNGALTNSFAVPNLRELADALRKNLMASHRVPPPT